MLRLIQHEHNALDLIIKLTKYTKYPPERILGDLHGPKHQRLSLRVPLLIEQGGVLIKILHFKGQIILGGVDVLAHQFELLLYEGGFLLGQGWGQGHFRDG